MKQRILSILLVLCMAASLVSVPALAEGEELSIDSNVETLESLEEAPEETPEPTEESGEEATEEASETTEESTELTVLSDDLPLDGDAAHSSHCVCGGDKTIGDHTAHDTNVTWTAWNYADSLPTTAGYYYLTTDVTISDRWYTYASGSTVLCLNGKTIRCSGIHNYHTLTITDCKGGGTISAPSSTGIYNPYGTVLNLYGGTITGNTAGGASCNCGGGVYNEGTFTMYDGCITNNTAKLGGGVYNAGTFTMSGGTISNNTAERGSYGDSHGGGVYNTKTFTMSGSAVLSGNKAGNNGGGVYNNGGTFTMSGGSITGNTANGIGGGVCVYDETTLNSTAESFKMSGGTISNNSSGSIGGGVFLQNGRLVMSGNAKITDNTSGEGCGAGGVRCTGYGSITVSGSVQITGNVAGGTIANGQLTGGAPDNVSLASNKSITANGLDSSAKIGISTDLLPQIVVTGSTDKTIFTSDNGTYRLTASGSDLMLTEIHEHNLCGKDTCTKVGGHTCTSTTAFEAWTKTDSLPTKAGNYYLTYNVTLSSNPERWSVPTGNTILCLNGKTIKAEAVYVIEILSSSTLTITDCKTTGKITHTSGTTGYGIYCVGNFNMYGGSITGNSTSTSNRGGGVYVCGTGTFNMYGGSITNNHQTNTGTSQSFGGGVHNDGTFKMYNGTISNNTAKDIGGGGVCNDGTFEMSGGTISGNTAGNSGGGVLNSGRFTMSGTAKITGNTATKGSGGGVWNYGTSPIVSFTMTGGTISGNKAGNSGGGVYNGKTFTMSGGTISGNTTTNNGGGVYSASGTFNLSGDALITGNKVTDANNGKGGGVFIDNGSFNMTGGSITGGSVTGNNANCGGGVYNDNGAFTMSGGTISGNKAYSGGGVDNHEIFTMSGSAKITGNTATSSGGGVRNEEGSTFTMNGSTISGNTATVSSTAFGKGGGVYNQGTFNMTSGTIGGTDAGKGNSGYNGGGVYITSTGSFTMSGSAAITGNNASFGGGVYNDGTATLSGDVTITGNTKNTTIANNLYLLNPKSLTIAESGLSGSANVGIKPNYDNMVILSDGSDTTGIAHLKGDDGTTATVNEDGKVVMKKTETATHTHSWSSTWTSDADSHWHTCQSCTEKNATAAHTWNDGVITTPATAAAAGVKTYTCTVCGKTKTVEIEKLDPVDPDSGDTGKTAPTIQGNSSVPAKQGVALTITSTANFADFLRVELDGKALVKDRDYTVCEGSTVVTLSAEYMAKLATGTHTLSIVSTSGTATARLTVTAAEQAGGDETKPDSGETKPDGGETKPDSGETKPDETKPDSKTDAKPDGAKQPPHTGDESHLVLWIVLLVVCIGAVAAIIVIAKKNKNKQ